MIAREQPEDFAPDWTDLPIDMPDWQLPEEDDRRPFPALTFLTVGAAIGLIMGALLATIALTVLA